MITNLNQLEEDELVKLFERSFAIKELLEKLLEIRENLIPLSKIIDPLNILFSINSYICVLYRSLFQNAEWIRGNSKQSIDPTAIFKTDFTNWENKHNEIIDYVNKVIAHQDISTRKEGFTQKIRAERKEWFGMVRQIALMG